MEANFDFGMIGIGVMGSNLLLNMADHGFSVIGFDLKQERADALEAAAADGTTVKGVTDITQFTRALKTPRKIMMLVPAGKPVDDVIANLLPHLESGDILIDGGNSFYQDTNARIQRLQPQGIHFFGMGVSGGELGARLGPSMMPGGDEAAYNYLKPILEAIAAKAGDKPCVAYMGRDAAGHYVKMVHNGIEYALMQLISEAYDLLRRGAGYNNGQLSSVFSWWNEGELQSYLVEITAEIFKVVDADDPAHLELVDKILDQAGSKGTGKWTSQDAMNIPVSIPTIDMAVALRDLSVYKEQRVEASRLNGQPVSKVNIDEAELGRALAFSFVIAYAQGLSLLAEASKAYGMHIPLPAVIQVWRAGCIIRSGLLPLFEKAFATRPDLPNLLLHPPLAQWLGERAGAARTVLCDAVQAGIPVAALGSAIAYYDAFRSERLPTNLIQAQRDYFGAHTYRRTDKDGVFHTEWNQ
ncbi:NADP-dependent phosphogluconate dehydrogenase [Flaviaesturariibacter flavus]|uniref:6-phosphogluconate dehydrogenase, decarboxylating n=1 Tax=Flaviaesturariibacter flavus TaxID=2502780 RepID=A0A4R1B397_9BACT|nr:NADP-dependent phosphogluconate dehydrogenase [Flaviaesturariibacter flavus]TCJ12514.1 NADP-dependent phosphogluconate dehydrogenase [Flaviaesturariibacter flavus]